MSILKRVLALAVTAVVPLLLMGFTPSADIGGCCLRAELRRAPWMARLTCAGARDAAGGGH